jgi:twinkle protein
LDFIKTHQPCPCGKSSDAYAIRADGSGKCFSGACGGKNFFPKDFWTHIKECSERPYASRGVPSYVGERLGFVEYVDDKGFVQFYGYNYPGGVFKARRVHDKHEQKMDVPKTSTKPALGGIGLYDPGTSRNCVVVEGEPDAAAAYYMLNDKMANETPVYWLLGAAISNKDKPVIYDELSKYERVIMMIENDESGNKAKETLAQLLPASIRVSNLVKHKDASDYLTNGDVKEFKRCFTNYSRYTPEYIFNGLDKLTAIWNEAEADMFIPTAFANLNELIKGVPLGHITLLTGQEGLGKTEILRSFAWSMLSNEEKKFPMSVTFFEEDNKTILKGFGCYDQGINFRDPDYKYPLEAIQPTLEKLSEDFYISDFYKAREPMSAQGFMDKVNYLHYVCGVRVFILDPINQLRPDDPDTNLVSFLDSVCMDMARFCVDTNSACVWTAHTTDEGKTRDSRMISKAASIRIDIHRDLETFDENERNRTYLTVSKNRPTGRTGPAGFVTFDRDSYTLVRTAEKQELRTEVGTSVEGASRDESIQSNAIQNNPEPTLSARGDVRPLGITNRRSF